ncbi:MAG: C39 family peptidase [Lachnospiraceae bacterium]|nr:C39 family peptidase [Lachnospiraceae bacterium]
MNINKLQRRKSVRKKLCQSLFLMLLAIIFFVLCIGKWKIMQGAKMVGGFIGGHDRTPCRSDDFVVGEFPLFLQADERWADTAYGSGEMAETGCGPTCLSMVVCALRENDEWMPPRMAKWAEKSGYYVAGAGTAWAMMSEGAGEFGISVKEITLSEERVFKELKKGHPIICTMGPGHFTTQGHYIVLYGLDDSGGIRIRDPKSRENSEKVWKLEDITPEIKNLWSYSI